MNNGLRPPKMTINVEAMPYFSSVLRLMRYTPVSALSISLQEPEKRPVRLCVSIEGRCGENEFIKRSEFVKDCFSAESYNLKNPSSFVLKFDFDCFEYDSAFLSCINKEMQGEIIVRVKYAGGEIVSKTPISLLEPDVWPGLDAEPSIVSAFVHESDEVVCRIFENVCEDGRRLDYASASKRNILMAVKKLYTALKDCNFIYTRPVAYAANLRQRIRRPDELFSSGSVLATPLEIALVFTACIEKMGLNGSLLFVRGKKADISVLCGVYLVNSPIKTAVCEDARKIRELVDAGDMLLVDPSIFAAAQNTSFVPALENTAELYVNNYKNLVCLVDVKNSLYRAGLVHGENEFEGLSAKASVARLYSSLTSSPVMQLLAGGQRCDIEEIPLLLPEFDKVFYNEEDSFRLMPLDISVKLEDYAAVDKDFSSSVTYLSPKARQHFSKNELESMTQKLSAFKEKITSDTLITTSLRDEQLYRTAGEMTFGKNKREPYFAFGYVKITDKLTESVGFAPICLVKASLSCEDGFFYVKQQGVPIVNKVFIRNALRDSSLGYDSFMKSVMPTDRVEIFDMFENIKLALAETDDRLVYELLREAHLVNVDIDDYILWSDLALGRNKLASNQLVKNVFSGEACSEQINNNYVPSQVLSLSCSRAVCSETDIVVEGAFTSEKEKTLTSIVQRNITECKSTLIVTDDFEMSQYMDRVLCENELSDMSYVVDESAKASGCIKKIRTNIEKYSGFDVTEKREYPKEYFDAVGVFDDYHERVGNKTSYGMSLTEAVEAYLGSYNETEGYDNIYVNREIFDNADEKRVTEIFELAGNLISDARYLCKQSGFDKYMPLKKHPLYYTNPPVEMDENAKNRVCIAIETALAVISEYSEVFADVNEILKLDTSSVDSFFKLEKLNELYKLVLSAKDIDIPEKFVEGDIARFSKDKRFENENIKRMRAIEKSLGFFNKEIFEDVENLLDVEEDEPDEEKGFLKRLIVRKSSSEMLLQYVSVGKRLEFQQQKTSEIYNLLREYRQCMLALQKSRQQAVYKDEETTRLGETAQSALDIVESLSRGGNDTPRLLSNIFRLISVIPIDALLARKMTVAMARLAELYTSENGALNLMSKDLGLNLHEVVFENGVLSAVGLSRYLSELEKNIDIAHVWASWKLKSNEAVMLLPGFIRCIDEQGAFPKIDKIFAKSLLLPLTECVRRESMKNFADEVLSRSKDKYFDLLTDACSVSKDNMLASFICSVKKACVNQKETGTENEVDEKISFIDYFSQNAALIKAAVPVLVVTKNTLTSNITLDEMFDCVIVIDNKNNAFTMLPALSYGKRTVLFNMSRISRSTLCERMSRCVPVHNVSGITSEKDASLLAWLNSNAFSGTVSCADAVKGTNVELVRMNGTYDRTTSRINMTEAEHSMVKATALVQNGDKTVALTAFTKQQCTALERCLCIAVKKNKVLALAKQEGRVSVCTPDRLYMKKYDSLVVSACFGADREARIGWDFDYAGVYGDEIIPEAYISIADRATEKTYILTSLNVRDSRMIRKSGYNAALFNSLCETLSDARIQVDMSRAKLEKTDSILENLTSALVLRNSVVMPCEGKQNIASVLHSHRENGLYVLIDEDRMLSMHDMLLIKKRLENAQAVTTTITPMSLTGQRCEQTIKGLICDNENI